MRRFFSYYVQCKKKQKNPTLFAKTYTYTYTNTSLNFIGTETAKRKEIKVSALLMDKNTLMVSQRETEIY